MEYLDICDEAGRPTGEIVERGLAHRDGILHRTAQVWVLRRQNGRIQVLLQKRSRQVESFPGLYDISSAGHIPARVEPLPSALRELQEELGIAAKPEELAYAGSIRCRYEMEFYGKPFRDNVIRLAFVYREPVDTDKLTLQKSEVEAVRWFSLEEVAEEVRRGSNNTCISAEELRVLLDYLKRQGLLTSDEVGERALEG